MHSALSTNNGITLIQGPPGTGKTTTIAELIQNYVSKDMKVLVCASSNEAVNNILAKYINNKPQGTYKNVIRYGQPDFTRQQLLLINYNYLL